MSFLRTQPLILLTIFVCVGVFFLATSTTAAPNYEINYQGKLTNASNVAVPNGTYNMRFWLLTSPSIATTSAVWSEVLTGTDRVQVTNGLFSVMLGSTSPLTGVDFNQTLYLGVEIGGTSTPAWDGEMSPRKVLGAVPAAFEARNARTIDNIATTSLLRSDEDDTASGLLTFTGGIVSTASSTITNLTTSISTTTMLVINGDQFTDLTGAGLVLSGGTLTCATATSAVFGCLSTVDWNTFNAKIASSSLDTSAKLAALLTDETGTGNVVFSASPTFTGTPTFTNLYVSPNGTTTLGFASTTALTVSGMSYFNFASSSYSSTTGLTATNLAISSLRDSTNSLGTNGFILQTNGNTAQWIATSSLGITGTNWVTVNGALTPSTTLGIRINASSTIGDGTGTGGLTIFGNATTTGNTYLSGTLGIGTTTPSATLALLGTGTTNLFAFASSTGSNLLSLDRRGVLMFGTTTSADIFLNGGATSTQTQGNGNNIAIGNEAFSYYTSSAFGNIALGYQALLGSSTVLMTGDYNFAVGTESLRSNTSGSGNNAVGFWTLKSNTTGAHNNAFGSQVLSNNTTGFNNIGFGQIALLQNTTGSGNTALGNSTLNANTTGSDNTAIGTSALISNTIGSGNFAVGNGTMLFNTTGSHNNAIGIHALLSNTTGSNNIAMGRFTGDTITTGSGNTFLGYDSDATFNSIATSTALGAGASVACTNCMVLGGVSTGVNFVNVGIGTTTPSATLFIQGRSTTSPFTVASSTNATLFNILANGNVGIGSSTPSRRLTVVGDAFFGNNITAASGTITYASTTGLTATNLAISSLRDSTNSLGTNGFILQSNGSTAQWVSTTTLGIGGGADGMSNWILANGALTPSTTLGIRANASSTIGDGTGGGGLTILGNATTTGNSYLNGTLGIGTTTPSATLALRGTGTTNLFAFASSTGSNLLSLDRRGVLMFGTTTGDTTGYYGTDIFVNGGATSSRTQISGQNIAIGNEAFSYYTRTGAFTGGLFNIALGYRALYGSSSVPMTGSNNFAAGDRALSGNTTGSDNIAIGTTALGENTVGFDNVALGNVAGFRNNGNRNNILGYYAGSSNAGSSNNLFGDQAGRYNVGSNNNAFGAGALYGSYCFPCVASSNGSNNNAFGNSAGSQNTGSHNNFLGFSSGSYNTGSYNNFFGYETGQENTGNFNEMIGYQTGLYVQSTSSILIGAQAFRGSGSDLFVAVNNTVVGYQAGYNATSSANNNILLGYRAADNLTTGANNIVIGYDVDLQVPTQSNTLNIGNLIFGTGIDGTGTSLSSGNIGIGTTTPSRRLTVVGDAFFGNNITAASGTITYASTTGLTATNLAISSLRDSTNSLGTNGFVLQSNGSTAQWVATSSLGISGGVADGMSNWIIANGALTPSTTLGIRINASSTIGDGTGAGGLTIFGNSTTTGNTYLNGTLGIGTTTPSATLALRGSGTTNLFAFASSTGSNLLSLDSRGVLMFGTTTISNGDAPNIFFNGGATSSLTQTRRGNIAIGNEAFSYYTTGTQNIALGYRALYGSSSVPMTGGSNFAVGDRAMQVNTTGSFNTAIGSNVMFSNTTGSFNAAIGASALFSNTTGQYNTAFGDNALRFNTTGLHNNAFGYWALINNTTGLYNIGIGFQSGNTITTGSSNVFIGRSTDATFNSIATSTAIGAGASVACNNCMVLGGVSTGVNFVNVGIGTTTPNATFAVRGRATTSLFAFASSTGSNLLSLDRRGVLMFGTTTSADIFLNGGATSSLTQTNRNNVAIGNEAFSYYDTTFANNNIALGYQALYGSSTNRMIGENNFGAGYQALMSNTEGGYNVAIGYQALMSNTTGQYNVAFGERALQSNITGSNNTALGYQGLINNTTGDRNNAIGRATLEDNTTGESNNAFGSGALRGNTTGSYNIGIGEAVLRNNSISSFNIGIGYYALYNSTGANNLGIGTNAGLTLETGRANTFIGHNADASANNFSTSTAIGAGAIVGCSNCLVLGGTGVNAVNVGIGTTTPNSRLTVAGDINIENAGVSFNNVRYLYADVALSTLILGEAAGLTNSGIQNNIIGINAGSANSGINNNIIGAYAGQNNTKDRNNILGLLAGVDNQGNDNNMFGSNTGRENTGNDNNMFGGLAGFSNSGNHNNFIGFGAGSASSGDNNNFFGEDAGSNNTGSENNYLGKSAGMFNYSSYNNFIGSFVGYYGGGSYNNIIGHHAGLNAQNTASVIIGAEAFRGDAALFSFTPFVAQNNTVIGYQAGYSATTSANNNILIGYRAANNLTTGANNIVIGYDIDLQDPTQSNTLNIGNLIFGTGIDGTGTTLSTGKIGIGTTTPNSKFSLQNLNFASAGVAGIDQYFSFTNSVEDALQYGNRAYLYATNTATTSLVGKALFIEDSTLFGNTIRGFEVQADRGNNVLGENTALSGFARTFGVRGVTAGNAGGVFEPAGVYGETEGTTQGNAIRGYSSSITTAALMKLFQDTSEFVGTGLLMNFGNGMTGSFSSTTASRFIDLQNEGTSRFTVGAYGMLTIGDGTTSQNAGIQIGYGGLCVDNDGGCAATVAGRIASVSTFAGNSDLAETYFSSEALEPGEVVYLKGGLSIGRADTQTKEKIIGVVSTKPGVLLGYDDTSLVLGEDAFPVALSGRVPVKLSNENGPIVAGDSLMLSSVPGVAMKATSTGKVIGIALEDFDESRAYSDTYINQFGDDLVQPVVTPIRRNDDPRINDGCYYGGGSALGEAPCVPLVATTTDGQIAEAEALAYAQAQREALAALALVPSARVTTTQGKQVRVGQVVMFVNLSERYLSDEAHTMITMLLNQASTTGFTSGTTDTIWKRLVTLANNFVDGVLSVFTLKADRVEVKNEICVDGVCLNADDIRRLLNTPQVQNGKDVPSGTESTIPLVEEGVDQEIIGENGSGTPINDLPIEVGEDTPPLVEVADPVSTEVVEENNQEETFPSESEPQPIL